MIDDDGHYTLEQGETLQDVLQEINDWKEIY